MFLSHVVASIMISSYVARFFCSAIVRVDQLGVIYHCDVNEKGGGAGGGGVKVFFANVNNSNFSKLDLCEGGNLSTAIFNSDFQLNVNSISCFISVCPFVAFLKATYAENSHIVLSCLH